MPICVLLLSGLLGTNLAASVPASKRPGPPPSRPSRESIEVKVLSVRLADPRAAVAGGFSDPNALTNPRTGTTCTMVMWPATTIIDVGILAPGGAGPVVDPITNNSLSPCVAGPDTPAR